MLVKRKSTTPGRRHRIDVVNSELHKGGPEKSLLVSGHKKKTRSRLFRQNYC